jgi:hypothetical protein
MYTECTGNGVEEVYYVSWVSYDYTYLDLQTFYEFSENGWTEDQDETYGYYENSNDDWFYGMTSSTRSYYEDSTGYMYEDIIGEITHGSDNYAMYWSSARAGGTLWYTIDNSFGAYVQKVFDENKVEWGEWGWNSEGNTWVVDTDGFYTITDKAGNESYYMYKSNAYYIIDTNSGSTSIWDESTHRMVLFGV